MLLPSEFEYLPDRQMWRAKTAQAVRDVLTDRALHVTDLGTYYQMLADEIGRDFPLIRHYVGYLLLTNDGPRHLELRKLAAAQFNASGLALREARARLIADAGQKLASPGEFDLMAEVVRPIAQGITDTLAGVSADFVASDILSPRRSLRKNRAIEARLGEMRADVAQRFPDEGEDALAIRVTLALLGTEPLTAGLGAQLLATLQQNPGRRLCDIDWPDELTEPAVLHSVRFAPSTLPVEACPMRAFMVETRLVSSPESGGRRGDIFGYGAHGCMGRGVSMIVWRELVARISALESRVDIIRLDPATHWLFNVPERIDIRIYHDA